jgi:2-polyprenyl-3-methyl-5-hydroxy-6-metoxy-1,4-benzoquinol methylase
MTISFRTRLTGALRLLIKPTVKPGRTLGDAALDGDSHAATSCPADRILSLDSCPVCGERDGTLVGEFNRFVHFAHPPDEASMRADYTLCHACSVVYAAKRPAGARYRWLLDHFEETLARAVPGSGQTRKAALSSKALTDDDRSHLKRLAARGVFVSEHTRPSRKDYLPAALSDRLAASVHVELLGSLLDLRGKRVLEVRSKLGSLPASLHRLFGADVGAMAIFEGQQLLIRELYGIPTSPIDFDEFAIPHPGQWDLIVCNHMLTHAVRPRDMLRTLAGHLTPGGHAYFYGEPDDAEILEEGKSMFNTLNAFHLQTFDAASFVRALAANGFETTFLTHHDGNILCLARHVGPPGTPPRIAAPQLNARLSAYRQAREAACLMLPASARSRVPEGWPALVERALKTGVAEISPEGIIRVRRADNT